MNDQLDQYAHLNTPIHRWDPRYKLIALLLLIFAFSFVKVFSLLPLMLAVTGALYTISGLPFFFLLARLRLPGYFLIMLAVILPLFSGQTVLFHLGPLAIREEGCLDMLLIGTRFACILTTGVVLFGSTTFLNTVKAMQSLGLPSILADMTLFSFRYLYVIGDNLKTMEKSMKLRGFRSCRPGSLGTYASLAGSLLVRSFEQSEQVYKAMILRGYSQPTSYHNEFQSNSRDIVALLVVLSVAVGFIVAEIFLR